MKSGICRSQRSINKQLLWEPLQQPASRYRSEHEQKQNPYSCDELKEIFPHLPVDGFITRGRIDNSSAQVSSSSFTLAETLVLNQQTPALSVPVETCCDMVPLEGLQRCGYYFPMRPSIPICCVPQPLQCSQTERAVTNLGQRNRGGIFFFLNTVYQDLQICPWTSRARKLSKWTRPS